MAKEAQNRLVASAHVWQLVYGAQPSAPPSSAASQVHDEADADPTTLREDVDYRGWPGGHHSAPAHLTGRPQLVTCSWSGFSEEAPTQIVGYQWAVSSSAAAPYAPDVMDWSSMTPNTIVASSNFSLTQLDVQIVYRCLVRAVNSAGGLSAVKVSDGFTFDETPPVNGQSNSHSFSRVALP